VDVAAYLKGTQVWVDAGVTPTAADLSAQTAGVLPPSLSSNPGHLNTAGYNAVAIFVARQMEATS
jgi:hypothetical protein